MALDGIIQGGFNINDRRTVGISTVGNLPSARNPATSFADGVGALQATFSMTLRSPWSQAPKLVDLNGVLTDHYGTESTDTYDTIDWLLKHVPNHNGKVGQWGISYPGFYTAAGMIDAHPALKAASPQAPVTDWFIGDDWHHNGALFLAHMFGFMSRHERPRPEPTKKFNPMFDAETPDGYQFFMRLGPVREAASRHLKASAPVLGRGGTARHLRRVLEGPQPPAAPQGHQAGGPDRRRLVRCREPFRRPGGSTRTSRKTLRKRRTSS